MRSKTLFLPRLGNKLVAAQALTVVLWILGSLLSTLEVFNCVIKPSHICIPPLLDDRFHLPNDRYELFDSNLSSRLAGHTRELTRCVPVDVIRITTRSPSAIMSSTFSSQSGNEARWLWTARLMPLSPSTQSTDKVTDKVS